MIQERFIGHLLVRELVQATLVMFSYIGWVALFHNFYGVERFEVSQYLRYGVVVLVLLVIQVFYSFNLKREGFCKGILGAKNAGWKATWITFSFLLFLATTKDQSISRVFLFSWFFIALFILLITEIQLPNQPFARFLCTPESQVRAVVYGRAPRNQRVLDWLMHSNQFGVKVIGVITNEQLSWSRFGIPILGPEEGFEGVSKDHDIGMVILIKNSFSELNDVVFSQCERRGMRCLALFDYPSERQYCFSVCPITRIPLVVSRREPLENLINKFVKRVVDVTISLFVVFFLLPLVTVLVWVLHRVFSPGRLFYVQKRSGVGNEDFNIIKYRTMHDVENRADQQATAIDDRVFRGGRLLRKMSIDELPQFFNVLIGNMSVVGPRPHLWEHSLKWAEDTQQYHIRSLVKPGITGLAQIRGYRGEARTERDIRLRVLSDIEYIETWSVGLDIEIIIKTATQVLFPPKTAY